MMWAPAMFSPSVLPVTVGTSRSSSPALASSACTAGMPPAAYRSGTVSYTHLAGQAHKILYRHGGSVRVKHSAHLAKGSGKDGDKIPVRRLGKLAFPAFHCGALREMCIRDRRNPLNIAKKGSALTGKIDRLTARRKICIINSTNCGTVFHHKEPLHN